MVEDFLKNPLFEALRRVGHKAEEDIYVWSQGMAFHYRNLLEGLKEVPVEKREKILRDVWSEVAKYAPKKIVEALRLDREVDLASVQKFMDSMMGDREFKWIKGVGDTVEEAMLNWVRAFAIFDYAIYVYLERHLGSKECFRIYMDLWEKFALSSLDHVKKALGITDETEINMDLIGKISRMYWESIGCPYKVLEHTPDRHVADVEICPYWENMKEVLGLERARSMTCKCEAAVSVNYYDAILKALGVFDKYSFTMEKWMCCGDEVCRVRFERRK
ncbi:MAG: hypothetical protein QXE22_03200 [Candidatus Bathyarchaeia archaeon]